MNIFKKLSFKVETGHIMLSLQLDSLRISS